MNNYWTTGKFDPDCIPSNNEKGYVGGALTNPKRVFGKLLKSDEYLTKYFFPAPEIVIPYENNKICDKTLICGHNCYDKVLEKRSECSRCKVPVTIKREECGHETTVYCSSRPPVSLCEATCTTALPCGHFCQNGCGKVCMTANECRQRNCWKARLEREKKDAEQRIKATSFTDTPIDDEEWITGDTNFDACVRRNTDSSSKGALRLYAWGSRGQKNWGFNRQGQGQRRNDGGYNCRGGGGNRNYNLDQNNYRTEIGKHNQNVSQVAEKNKPKHSFVQDTMEEW